MGINKGPLAYTTLDETGIWHLAGPTFTFRDDDSVEDLAALLKALRLATHRVQEELGRRALIGLQKPFTEGEVQR